MKKTYLMAGIAILLWSTMATISKLLLGNFDQYQVLCVSALFAALALFGVNLLSGKLKKLKTYRPKDYLHMLFRDCWEISFIMRSLMPAQPGCLHPRLLLPIICGPL